MVLQILLSYCSLDFPEAVRAFLFASVSAEARVLMGIKVRASKMAMKA